jgi:hypothetical protein
MDTLENKHTCTYVRASLPTFPLFVYTPHSSISTKARAGPSVWR